MLAAIGQKAVSQTDSFAVGYFVAIPLVMVLVEEGFRVSQPDARALATGDGQLRIGGGQRFAVEKNMDVNPRWKHRGLFWKVP